MLVNNNQKRYQIIIKKRAFVTFKYFDIFERDKGYFPLFIFFRYNSILIIIHLPVGGLKLIK